MSHGDLAYSTEGLPAHTDTTYFTDPAGLQIFHMLSHPPPGTGGTSLLVDGFYAANLLRELSPSSYATLSRLRIPAHASGTPGTMLRPTISQPVFRHDENGELAQVRWNNEDRGVIGQGWSPEDVRAWYKAAKEYERLLKGEDAEYWVQLSPGTMVGEFHPFIASCWVVCLIGSDRQLAGDAWKIAVHGVKTDVRSICWRRRLEVQTDSYQAGAFFGQRR
jgi:trimethyllysine dioxygenase